MVLSDNAQLALDTIHQKPTKGIPISLLHIMEHEQIERLAGAAPGDYARKPVETYLAFQKKIGTCVIDQWIPDNPLSMSAHGYKGKERGATTGAEQIVLDGMTIDSPEAVIEHMERFLFPSIKQQTATFDEEAWTKQIIEGEAAIQELYGPDILKVPYGVITFPGLFYFHYGYANYFMAVALYPDVIEKHFSLQADFALRFNRAAVKAYAQANLPPLCRLDHDMADSRGTLVNIKMLDKIWFPHFARCLEPVLQTDIKMIWHCDGNLMEMVPRLLDCGLKGFQGFQYEDGMDYERICKMKTRNGEDLIIIGGVSVTRTLPMGTPADVKHELDWLVEYGPKTGLFLAGTSSITPGVPWENITTLVEGLNHYKEHGRNV